MRALLFGLLFAMVPLYEGAHAQDWRLTIVIDGVRSKSNVTVLQPAQTYRATIYAIGPYTAPSPNFPVAKSFADLARHNQNALVFNGGPSRGGPYQPAGLLLIRTLFGNSFSFEKKLASNKTEVYALSAVLCQSNVGKLSILKTESYTRNPERVAQDCSSALQTGPILLEGGRNVITPEEITIKDPGLRTIMAFDRHGIPSVVMFEKPTSLRVAAEFLRSYKSFCTGTARVEVDTKNGSISSTCGLGLWGAVNLDGGVNSILEYPGHHRPINNDRVSIPTAIVLADQ